MGSGSSEASYTALSPPSHGHWAVLIPSWGMLGGRPFAQRERFGRELFMLQVEDQLGEALRLIERALELIDSTGKVHDVGAHLDLAVNRLREHVDCAEQASAK